MSKTVGSATLTTAQLNQLKLASSKSGAVPKSVLEEVIKGSLALLPKVRLKITMRTLELVQPFLPHLNFEIFWGFPLSYVVLWRGL